MPVSVIQTTARNRGEETCPFCSGTGKVMCTACLVSIPIVINSSSAGLSAFASRRGVTHCATCLHDTDLLCDHDICWLTRLPY